MKEKIAKWYRQGLWSSAMVQNAVGKLLTREEADDIILEGAEKRWSD